MNQNTIKKELYFSGVGLHSGMRADMKICPAPANTGIWFQRTDLPGEPSIEALADYVIDTARGTVLCHENVRISTLEHLMSAFYGMGIDNAIVQLSGWEVPILDGSAKPFVEAISLAGIEPQMAERKIYTPTEPILFIDQASGTHIEILPSDHFSAQVTIDFNSEIMGRQQMEFNPQVNYSTEIAPCRTFVFLHEVLYLYRHNLVKGGDLDNALVISEKEVSEEEQELLRQIFNKPQIKVQKGYLNHLGLRFPNECVRHKTLDLLGDFMLAGVHINANVVAFKPGHGANTTVAKMIRQQMNS